VHVVELELRIEELRDELADATAWLAPPTRTPTTMTTVTMIPATDTPVEALPICLAATGSETAVLFATTATQSIRR